MDELRPITEYINTTLGAAGLAAAAFAANWVRNVVHKYFAYLEAKVRRWNAKAIVPQVTITPELQNAIETAASRMLMQMIKERKDRAKPPPG